jgi:hypothetical protein
MDPTTVDSALSIVAHRHNQWSSGTITITVFSTLASDDPIELDLCDTLCVRQKEPEIASLPLSREYKKALNLTSDVSSEIPNFGISETFSQHMILSINIS